MLGERVKMLRKEKNITQLELAKVLGISQSTVGMIEAGKRDVSIDLLNKLADYFNVSTDFLLGRTDNRTGMIITNKELDDYLPDDIKAEKVEVEIEKVSSISEEELKMIADFVIKKIAEHGGIEKIKNEKNNR